MSLSEFFKRFKRTIARIALRICSLIIKIFPRVAIYGFAGLLARLGYHIAIRQRRIALESLSIAFRDEKNNQEIISIAKACFDNLAKGMVELLYIMDHPYLIRKSVDIEGKEHLDKAFREGKGVIGVSAHFGNFPLMLLRFAQEGYKTNAIIRATRDEKVESLFREKRNMFGIKTLYSHPRKLCVENSLKALRNNEFLFIPLDQNFGTGGIFVDFFGRQAATATGPVIFALRTNAPILPMFIIRQKDNRHKIIIEEPLYIEEKADYKQTVLYNISRITKLIENYIRRYPEEWGWMHRRWKSRPKVE